MINAIDVNIDAKVFNDVYVPHLDNYARTQIFYGGSGSGKSVFLAQRCVIDLMKGGRNYLICRAVGKYIRRSVYVEIKKVIDAWELSEIFSVNKTDGTVTCANGYQAIFVGLDDTQKLKSITPQKGVFTDIWVEEATETERKTIKDLFKRQRGGSETTPKRMVLSFNPILQQHWIYQDYFATLAWSDTQTEYKSDDLSIQKTWYVHNKFLTPDDVADLENEKDSYFFNVYTLGNWGVLGNVIFTNWSVEDLSDMRDQFTDRRNGLDFGFSTDPAALSVSHYDKLRKTIYIFDELYETGLTNDVLAEEVKKVIKNDRVVCDSAEPKSIAELRRYGVDAIGAKKGRDSVLHGVQWLQQQKIVIDKNCVNARNEFMQYKWKENADGITVRRGGLPVPVDSNNHLIDSTRYAYESDMLEMTVEVVANPFYN